MISQQLAGGVRRLAHLTLELPPLQMIAPHVYTVVVIESGLSSMESGVECA